MPHPQTSVAEPLPALSPQKRLETRDACIILGLLALTVATFANGLAGDFVHDDTRQIVRNELIRNPQRWGYALTHDVWSFLGERDNPWSNYWRPGHVAWLILNVQIFGAANPVGWHVTNLLAHLGVIAAAYAFLRRLGAARGVIAAILCIFAIHPTRAESVTWIAGVHDVLCTLWQLLALLTMMSYWERGGRWKWAVSLLLFMLAVSTKEIAIFFPIFVAAIRYTDPAIQSKSSDARRRTAVAVAIPFAVIAALFLVARYLVLGQAQIAFVFRPSLMMVAATLPMVICFYVLQMIWPYQLGWSYPIRIVSGANSGVMNFWLPVLLTICLIALVMRIRWTRFRVIGGLVCTLALLPALNLRAFPPENLVKDRFLYLPLLGFLMVVISIIADWLTRRGERAVRIGAGVCAILVIALATRTVIYNRAWLSDIALWEAAIRSDPMSAMNHHQLASMLLAADQVERAREMEERAMNIEEIPLGHLTLSDINLKEGRLADATDSARRAVELIPWDYRSHERLAISLQKRGRFDEAEQVLRQAIRAVPSRRAYFADQLGVILYLQGKRDEAQAELEAALPVAESEFGAPARLVFFHLGLLYQERGRHEDARRTLKRFLDLTDRSAEPTILAAQKQARAMLNRRF